MRFGRAEMWNYFAVQDNYPDVYAICISPV